ncbi:CBS domain-containing protein [Salipaludibacillus agaradhaerens]|uniref:cyclic di-AMP binding protein CbpA n=1 Tax=Salipaludibacillus agaradhaerens TaxID=76935 RepID=UPI002151C362|nr:cyclic di-AMP binding protein CbpA [Salipaludibacillus agaradhaerens]MCR6106627.1 CBS domain-containing protein [Salipaludibacillus agaradhaerens]MCR6118660.1 CBS domain-containing protein [Salipaludibacillus agaradhaerens]UJW57741.1 CBS domain-containing protein [Bacillus sp. A116_S68]
MKIKYNVIPKEDVRYCDTTFTIKEAAKTLEDSGFRCIPVLDDTGNYFKGNIYIQHIYRAIVKDTVKWEDSITKLIHDEKVHIEEQASFFRIFSRIKRYPYLAVLNAEHQFAGILTHANVMEILEDSWGIQSGRYTLTVSTHEYQGALSNIVASVKKFTNIQSLMTLDNESTFFRRVIITLPESTTNDILQNMINHLETEGFRVFDVEKI